MHFGGRVRFVYRHFPLEEVYPHALHAALAAEAAGVQKKFWQMYEVTRTWQHLKQRALRREPGQSASLSSSKPFGSATTRQQREGSMATPR